MIGRYISFTDKEEYDLVRAVLKQPLLYFLGAGACVHLWWIGDSDIYMLLALFLVPALLIDAKHMILPDILTVTALVVGLFIAPLPIDIKLWGAGIGIGLFALLEFVMTRALGRPALGWGDVKLLGALGAWGGVLCLPLVLLFASFSALIYVGWRRIKCPIGHEPFPFGPFLIIGGWIAIIYGQSIWLFLHG